MAPSSTTLKDLWQAYGDPAGLAKRRDALRRGCWIYGAGGYGRRVLNALRKADIPCHGFIDRRAGDAALQKQLGHTICAPDDFSAQAAPGPLVVGVMNTAVSLTEPQTWGRGAGFDEIIMPGLLPELLDPALANYWMTERRHYLEYGEQYARVYNLLEDQRSRDIYESLLTFRMSGDPLRHPAVDLQRQYAPDDVPLDFAGLCLVDGGAFTGDTFETFARLEIQVQEWYAFEPDLRNFRTLSAIKTPHGMRAVFFPCGLADQTADLSFTDGEGAGSHLGESAAASTSTVRVVALDDVLAGARPTYIKLDIEGYEAEALAGMTRTLARQRAALAVCIYHKPQDLFSLPLLVHAMMPEARLYVRQHGHSGFDTVLYALPQP